MAYEGEQRRQYQRGRYHTLKAKGKFGIQRGRPKMAIFTLRVPVTWIAQIQRMASEAIALGNAPWKTSQDVGRALFTEGFIALKEKYDSVGEFVPMLRLQQRLADVDRARSTAQQMLAMAKQNVQAMIDIDQQDSALSYFHSAMIDAEDLPPTVWSDWLVRELRKTFPRLSKLHDMNKIPSVPLGTTYAVRAKQQTTQQKRKAVR